MQHKLLKLENKVHRGKPGQTPTEQHQENMKYFTAWRSEDIQELMDSLNERNKE